MLVEFQTVVADYKEQKQKSIQEELNGIASVQIENENDKLCSSVIDMTSVIGWDATNVQFNDKFVPCVYANLGDEHWSRALVIEPEKFKRIWEIVNRDSVKSISEVLNEQGI